MRYAAVLLRKVGVAAAAFGFVCIAWSSPAFANCEDISFAGDKYSICAVDPRTADIRIFLRDGAGQNYGSFSSLRRDLEKKGETLAFAMNGGMYHPDYRPVGLHVENGKEIRVPVVVVVLPRRLHGDRKIQSLDAGGRRNVGGLDTGRAALEREGDRHAPRTRAEIQHPGRQQGRLDGQTNHGRVLFELVENRK